MSAGEMEAVSRAERIRGRMWWRWWWAVSRGRKPWPGGVM